MAVITISRQFGAGGWSLGERLAKRLGYRCINEGMIQEVAKKGKISSGRVRVFEKSGTNKLMKFLDKLVFTDCVDRFVSERHGHLDEKGYVEIVRGIFQELHEKDNVIIIGRGGQYILKGYPNTYHVLLVGSMKSRIQLVMDTQKLTESKAKIMIKKGEDQRRQVLRLFSGHEFHDNPMNYDLVINTTQISLQKTEELMINLVSE
jgi:cytidylate kinase